MYGKNHYILIGIKSPGRSLFLAVCSFTFFCLFLYRRTITTQIYKAGGYHRCNWGWMHRRGSAPSHFLRQQKLLAHSFQNTERVGIKNTPIPCCFCNVSLADCRVGASDRKRDVKNLKKTTPDSAGSKVGFIDVSPPTSYVFSIVNSNVE